MKVVSKSNANTSKIVVFGVLLSVIFLAGLVPFFHASFGADF